MDRRLRIAILVLALVGFAIAAVSFAHKESFVSGSFCTIGASFNCDVVNRGPYSEIAGVPVAVIGMIGYAFLAVATLLSIRQPNDRGYLIFIALATLGGFAFSLYLTSIEAFVLKTYCLLCLTSQSVILALVVLVVILCNRVLRRKPTTQPLNDSTT